MIRLLIALSLICLTTSLPRVSHAQPTTSEICLPRLQAERALEALQGCPRLVELDDLRLRFNDLLATHRDVKAAAVDTDRKRAFAEGRAHELGEQLRAGDLRIEALIETRTRQDAEIQRLQKRWPWYVWAAIGVAIGAAGTGTGIAVARIRRPDT